MEALARLNTLGRTVGRQAGRSSSSVRPRPSVSLCAHGPFDRVRPSVRPFALSVSERALRSLRFDRNRRRRRPHQEAARTTEWVRSTSKLRFVCFNRAAQHMEEEEDVTGKSLKLYVRRCA